MIVHLSIKIRNLPAAFLATGTFLLVRNVTDFVPSPCVINRTDKSICLRLCTRVIAQFSMRRLFIYTPNILKDFSQLRALDTYPFDTLMALNILKRFISTTLTH